MRKLTLAFLAIMAVFTLAANIFAQSDRQSYSDFMYRRTSTGTFTPMTATATALGTGTDTTGIIWISPDLVPYGTLWLELWNYNATETFVNVPDLSYKLLDQDSRPFSSDSAEGWTTIFATAESLKTTITAGDTMRWYVEIDWRQQCPAGFFVKCVGNKATDSTHIRVRYKGAKLLGTDKAYSRPGTF